MQRPLALLCGNAFEKQRGEDTVKTRTVVAHLALFCCLAHPETCSLRTRTLPRALATRCSECAGWRLATSHGKRAGCPARSRWSAAGRNDKEEPPEMAGLGIIEDLEWVRCLPPWEVGKEVGRVSGQCIEHNRRASARLLRLVGLATSTQLA